jgi:hypothetical protein
VSPIAFHLDLSPAVSASQFRVRHQMHPHRSFQGLAVEEAASLRLDAKSSILDAAPCLTNLPTSTASATSCASAPLSRARVALIFRQGWQLAVTDAPTAINLFSRSSSFMVYHLLAAP